MRDMVEPGEDSVALLTSIDRVSQEISGQRPDELAAAITAGLLHEPVRAAGLWLGDDAALALHAWQSRPDAPLDPDAAGAAVTAVPPTGLQTEIDESRLVLVPLRRGERAIGVLGLVTTRPVTQAELSALSLLARQVSAELDLQQILSGHATTMSEFVALITHELRSPLTALRGNVQLAMMGARKGDLGRVAGRLEAALKGVDGITVLIQNLQDVSQLERGKFHLHLTPGQLGPVVETAARRAERMAELDQPVIEVAQVPLTIEQDATRLEHAFFNIFMNALQYSGAGPVQASVEQDGAAAVVTIADRGIGISDDDLPRVFEPYYRGSSAVSRNAKGLGLGLTVCRATVERHGGQIELHSQPGEGTTVVVRLPRGSGG